MGFPPLRSHPVVMEVVWLILRWVWRRGGRMFLGWGARALGGMSVMATRQRRRIGQIRKQAEWTVVAYREWLAGAWAFRKELCMEMR